MRFGALSINEQVDGSEVDAAKFLSLDLGFRVLEAFGVQVRR